MLKTRDLIYLAQTDTTAGFLSINAQKLNAVKGRELGKKLIRAARDLSALKEFARTPQKYKNFIRRSQKTTFIFPNGEAIRVIYGEHQKFFADRKWVFSTSANQTNEKFDIKFALKTADVILRDNRGFFESPSSKIYKISRSKIKTIR